ncbi:MAG: PEP-CTERM sorting domain-containing protein [Bryobacteraceae bacterium]
MKLHACLYPAALLIAAAFTWSPTALQAGVLETTYAAGNGGASGWSVLFDLNVLASSGITITALDVNVSATAGTAFTLDIYTRTGTASGFETNSGGWTLVSSGSGSSAGQGNHSAVNVTDFFLAQGISGVAVRYLGVSPAYTNGNTPFSNADVSLTGVSSTSNSSGPFTGSINNPRTWNGTIYYDASGDVPEPSTVLLAGIGLAAVMLRVRSNR